MFFLSGTNLIRFPVKAITAPCCSHSGNRSRHNPNFVFTSIFSSTPATKKPSKPSVVLLVPRTLNVKILKRRKLLVTTPACKQSSSIGNFLDDRIAEVIQADQRGPVGVPLAATRREQHPHHNDTVTADQQPSGGGMPRQANSFSYLPTVSNSNGQPEDSHNEEIG